MKIYAQNKKGNEPSAQENQLHAQQERKWTNMERNKTKVNL